jgi:hypothetical protein
MAERAELIVETDDDNLPLDAFWANRQDRVEAHVVENAEWVNIYTVFSNDMIWPKGFPIDLVKSSNVSHNDFPLGSVYCPI